MTLQVPKFTTYMEVKKQRGDQIEVEAEAGAVVTVVACHQEAAVGALTSLILGLVTIRQTPQLSLRTSQKTNIKTR